MTEADQPTDPPQQEADSTPESGSNHELRPDRPKDPVGSNDSTVLDTNSSGRDSDGADEFELVDSRSVPPGIGQLGKYRMLEQIGRGGMGVVWKAFDPDLHRTVAIKILGEQLRHSLTARRRFQREARAAAAINHTNVLTIHSVEVQDEIPFLVMEYVNGQSLKEYVASKGKLNSLEVIQLASQITQGLAAAHEQGVIHRDVKPGNVMLYEGATSAQLTDFGLARVTFDNVELTSHDQCVGTPSYMCPESLQGRRVDARSDLFSLGCVLYLMQSGHSPFQGQTQAETIQKILNWDPPALRETDAAIPPVLSDITNRLLQKNPDDRFQSAAELADVLTQLLQQINQAPTDEITGLLATAAILRPRPQRRPFNVLWLAVPVIAVAGLLILPRLLPDNGDGGPVTHSVVPSPNPGPERLPETPSTVTERLSSITVGPDVDADFESISEAVDHADVGATITVAGPGPYTDHVRIQGSRFDGLRLIADPPAVWKTPDSGDHRALVVSDVKDIHIEGFEFHVDDPSGRAMQVSGDARNISIEGCEFRHLLKHHSLSLMNVMTTPGDADSVVAIRTCRFWTSDGPGMCLALGSDDSAARVVCSHCAFTGPKTLVYAKETCRQLTLTHNIFRRGNKAINVSLNVWWPDSHVEIVNNTFVDCEYWIGLMDSFRQDSVPEQPTSSRICNNLILGGKRVQGGDDQWNVVFDTWTLAANWWERDVMTQSDADRGGQLATLHAKFDIPQRDAIDDDNYLVPVAGSPLLTSGVGDDLPTYIGARSGDD